MAGLAGLAPCFTSPPYVLGPRPRQGHCSFFNSGRLRQEKLNGCAAKWSLQVLWCPAPLMLETRLPVSREFWFLDNPVLHRARWMLLRLTEAQPCTLPDDGSDHLLASTALRWGDSRCASRSPQVPSRVHLASFCSLSQFHVPTP